MKVVSLILRAIVDLVFLVFPARFFYGKNRAGFVFLSNPRNIHDLYTKYPFLKHFNESITKRALRYMWPFAVAKVYGLNSLDKKHVSGWIFGISLTAEEILKDKTRARKKIKQAIRLAENYGLRVVGLGGYTSSVTDISEMSKYIDPILTSGSTYTAVVSAESVADIVLKYKKNLENINIAIVGATGSVGKIFTHILLSKNARRVRIFSKTLENLERLHKELIKEHPSKDISYSVDLSNLSSFDLIVLATNAPSALIQAGHLKGGAIVYDISQPKNISQNVVVARPDCFFFEGGLVRQPSSIRYHFDFKLNGGSIFGCMAETMIIAAAEFDKGLVKEGDRAYVELLRDAGFALGFTPYYYELNTHGNPR